jgi:hypothetical protein
MVVTADPARDAECPATFPGLEGLKPLAASTLVLPDGAEVVPLDAVLDRDEITAVAIGRMREAWQRCRAVVDYRARFDALMREGK